MLRHTSYVTALPVSQRSSVKTRVLLCCMLIAIFVNTSAQTPPPNATRNGAVPQSILIRIVIAEDQRRWDSDLQSLLTNRNPAIRRRAALAAGRIGNEDSVAELVKLLTHDTNQDVRAMAAFGIGEIESVSGAPALLAIMNDTKEPGEVRARSVEALGKIAAALPKEQETRAKELGASILEALRFENGRRSRPDRLTILLGLTAALRSKPANAGPTIAAFLGYADSRVRADAANSLARLRVKDGNDQLRKLLTTDPDAVVRSNAARVLGATEDKAAFDGLVDRSLNDTDSRVRVSAVRALSSLKDPRAVDPLLKRGALLAQGDVSARPSETNEVLEIATTLGRLLPAKDDESALNWLRKLREAFSGTAPEVEIAFARISPGGYLAEFGVGAVGRRKVQETILVDWRSAAGIAQGLGEIATVPEPVKNKPELANSAETLLRAMLDYRNSGININTLVAVHSEYAIPEIIRALAAFKPKDLAEVLRVQLNESDVVVRATAAELLGGVPNEQVNARALAEALPRSMTDSLNDAALAILESLAKQKSPETNAAIQTALDSNDHLLRRKAVALLKANAAGDFFSRIGNVQSRNTMVEYRRAVLRMGTPLQAVVTTARGSFTIELLPEEATLTVDNFIQLAKRGYFDGITIHRVVPNFVIQDGDPRGDGNGGPGYQIRCEINTVPYDRAAVGMALSGKDTGGSQWFVTHSPQPHLDGGYTVFGRVVAGMDVVDGIVRGDAIRSIVIKQGDGRR